LPGPIAHAVLLECRLAHSGSRTDFIVGVNAAGGGRDALARSLRSGDVETRWEPLRRFTEAWSSPESPLYEAVESAFLEFDSVEQDGGVSAPSIFFNGENERTIRAALPALLGSSVPEKIERKLYDCYVALSPPAGVYQLGAMFSRNASAIRLTISNVAPSRITDYLDQVGWGWPLRPLAELISRLARLADVRLFDIDVSEAVGPVVGIECYLSRSTRPSRNSRWKRFLDELGSAGLCLPQKREGLLEWPGFDRDNSTSVLRWLNHVKIVYRPDQPLEAKAYLGCRQFACDWPSTAQTSAQLSCPDQQQPKLEVRV
jgi:hypothetical protein